MLLIAASFAVIWLIQVQIDAGGKLRLVRRAGSGPKAFSDRAFANDGGCGCYESRRRPGGHRFSTTKKSA